MYTWWGRCDVSLDRCANLCRGILFGTGFNDGNGDSQTPYAQWIQTCDKLNIRHRNSIHYCAFSETKESTKTHNLFLFLHPHSLGPTCLFFNRKPLRT